MRPDRAVVKQAIVDAGGNLSRAASLLGRSRQTLYTYIYQHGLERLAGVRVEGGSPPRPVRGESGLAAASPAPAPPAAPDPMIQATVRIRESVWKAARIAAIQRGTTVAAVVAAALARELAEPTGAAPPREARTVRGVAR
jgi:Bacterial regulatory protein, Fis family